MQFVKFQGFGNDYIVIEAAGLTPAGSLNDFAKRICDRHYGAGADGIVIVEPGDGKRADFEARIFNADGSEAGLSGNGTRCAASYIYHQELWSKDDLRLGTRAGAKLYRLRERPARGTFWFDSELGKPRFESSSIPMATEPLPRVLDYPLVVLGETLRVTALEMGNPNCCIFVNDFEELDWRRLGRAIESHPLFPERTNVTFVRVRDRQNIELRIWERGVGETFASGTCSCAAVIAAAVHERTERRVSAWMPGGRVEVNWRDDGEVVLTGRADIVYRGEWQPADGV
jgi:diaminopimelate epimerase